jgi:hypothetical protein
MGIGRMTMTRLALLQSEVESVSINAADHTNSDILSSVHNAMNSDPTPVRQSSTSQSVMRPLPPIVESEVEEAPNADELEHQKLEEAKKAAELAAAAPIIPSMQDLCHIWFFIAMFVASVNFFSPYKSQALVVAFQISITATIFLISTVYRMRLIGGLHLVLQTMLQAVVIFTPIMIFIVLFTSIQSYTDWGGCLSQYKTGLKIAQISKWGAGDFFSILLDPALVSLAFASVDAFITYYYVLPALVPAIWISCMLVTIQGSLLAFILQSTPVTALPMVTRTVTTPVAINLSGGP